MHVFSREMSQNPRKTQHLSKNPRKNPRASEKMKTQDGPIKKPRKPKVKFLYVFFKFLGKIDFSREKSQLLPKKIPFYPLKILRTLIFTFFPAILRFPAQIYYRIPSNSLLSTEKP